MKTRIEPVAYYDEPDRKVVDLRPCGVSFVPLASRTVCRYTRDSPGLHVHPGLGELVYCVRGALSFETPGSVYPFLPGDVFVSGPDEPHTMSLNLKGSFVYRLLVKWPGRGKALPGLTVAETAILVKILGNGSRRLFAGGDEVRRLFDRLFAIYGDFSGGAAIKRMQMRMCALEILLACASASASFRRSASRIGMNGVKRWIASMTDSPDSDFDVDGMARESRLTPLRFRSMFKHATGLPVHAYLMLCRIEAAKRFLRSRPGTSELALAVRFRFSGSSHFSRTFKSIVGKTFAEYARSIKENKAR